MLSESEKIDWNIIQACRAMVSASGSGMWGMRLICWNSSFGTTRSTSKATFASTPGTPEYQSLCSDSAQNRGATKRIMPGSSGAESAARLPL